MRTRAEIEAALPREVVIPRKIDADKIRELLREMKVEI